jgi:DNA-binding NtrC family response regulator
LEDIPLLVDTFLKKLNRFSLKDIRYIEPGFLHFLQSYNWPGNIRELENLIERAFIVENTSMLTINSLPKDIVLEDTVEHSIIDSTATLKDIREKAIQNAERQYLIELLKRHHGRINATAQAAGLGARQLHKLMRKYELKKEDFKQKTLTK